MKLKFSKDENGEIALTVNSRQFDTRDYLEIVKNIKEGGKLEVEDLGDNISTEEQESINKMIEKINGIDLKSDANSQEVEMEEDTVDETIDPDDLPF